MTSSTVGAVIGLDIGTTAAKVVAFQGPHLTHPPIVREYPLLRDEPDAATQDPDVVVTALLDALAECVRRLDGAPVELLSVSTAMHALIGLDRAGRPVTPIITWADGRARSEARLLRGTADARALHTRTGTPVHSMSPFVKLRWLTRHDPVLCARVSMWVGLKDLVIQALTGQLVTELSSASGTGLLDLATRGWDPEAVRSAGIHLRQLPPVLPTTAQLPLATAAAGLVGLPASTPVVVGAGDGPLGNLGSGATARGVAGLSLGTSGALRLLTDQPYADPEGRLFCYALTDDLWAVGTPVSNGGSVIRWAGSLLASGPPGPVTHAAPSATSDADLLALAETVPTGSDGLLMLPFLLPERGPLWDPDLRGAFIGIRERHTRAHFVRAAVEGVALQLATVLEDVDRVVPVTAVRATGGAFRSPLWARTIAAALDRPLTVTSAALGTALGAAALGMYAVGEAATPADGLDLLVAPDDYPPPVVPDRDAVHALLDARASLPHLLAQLSQAAGLLTAGRPVPA